MTACCYIIFSKKLNRFYTGATNNDLSERLKKHNLHKYGNHRYTAKADDWTIFLKIEAIDYAHAIRMERKVKAMKSTTYIKNLKKYDELRTKLIKSTST